jgi:hypothetical protein
VERMRGGSPPEEGGVLHHPGKKDEL